MWWDIKQRFHVILLIVTAVVIVIMIYSSLRGYDKANFISSSVGVIITPVEKAFSFVINGISGGFGNIASLGSAKTENEKLKLRLTQLEGDVRDLEEYKNENERLRELLELKHKEKNFETVGAEVIAKDPGNYFTIFTIDKGSLNGLNKNNVVICDKGLIGYIFDIGATWAKVMTAIDVDCSVGAMLTRTGERVVVEGDVELIREGLCKMIYIPKNANIMAGDPIETSGLGGIFPRGIFIGRVKEIKQDVSGISKYVVVEPSADFQRIRNVLVIKGIK